jgi:hypothetical protein
MPEAVRQQFFKNAEETTPVKHVGTPEEMAEGKQAHSLGV